MNNPPAFRFYPADWLADAKVQAMSLEAEGIYIRLLCYCWREGSIPADRLAIAKLCKGYDGPAIDEVLPCFVPVKKNSNKLRNKRLYIERKKQIEYHEAMKKAGIDGANKRWHSHSRANSQAKKKPLAKNSSSLSLSSSLSYKEEDLRKSSNIVEKEFADFWESYPNKEAKDVALAAFRALRKKESLETIARAFNGYVDFLKNERIRNHFDRRPMNASTFLRKNRWRDFLDFKYKAPL